MIGAIAAAPPTVMPPARGAADDAAKSAFPPSTSAAGAGSSPASAETTAGPAGAEPSAEAAPAGAVTRRATAHDGPDPNGATPGDFAALLAASGPADTVAAPAAAPVPPGSSTAEASATDPAAELPDQFLALLSGSWAMPAAASPLPPGSPALPGNAAAPPLPAATASAVGLPPTVAPPATATATAIGAPFAALAAGASPAADERAGSDRAAGPADASAALDGLVLASTAPSATAAARAGALPPAATLALPADPDAGFDDGFGARIAWMAEQRLGHAQIRLNPEHVGPIDVRVQLDGNRVSAEFSSAHAEVRQAIEASLPRLREMLGQHGLQLGQADVGQGQSGRRGEPSMAGGHHPSLDTEPNQGTATGPIRSRGLLDEYA